MIVEDVAYKGLMDIPESKPPRSVLRLSGYDEPAKKKAHLDLMQFSFPGFAPKFGEVGKKKLHRRRAPQGQEQLFSQETYRPLQGTEALKINSTTNQVKPEIHHDTLELIFQNIQEFRTWNARLSERERLAFMRFAVRFTQKETGSHQCIYY